MRATAIVSSRNRVTFPNKKTWTNENSYFNSLVAKNLGMTSFQVAPLRCLQSSRLVKLNDTLRSRFADSTTRSLLVHGYPNAVASHRFLKGSSQNPPHPYVVQNSWTMIAIVAGAIASIGSIASMWMNSSGDSSKKISKEELIQIYTELANVVEQMLGESEQIMKMLREKAATVEENVSEEQILAMFRELFGNSVAQAENEIYKRFGCTAEDVFNADSAFDRDPLVQQAMERLKLLLHEIQLDYTNIDIPHDLTKEKLLHFIEDIMTTMVNVMEETIESLEKEGIQWKDDKQKLQERYLAKAQPILAKKHEESEIPREIFAAALAKFQNDKEFVKKVEALQIQQQKAFEKMGI